MEEIESECFVPNSKSTKESINFYYVDPPLVIGTVSDPAARERGQET